MNRDDRTNLAGSLVAREFDGEPIESYFIREDGDCELVWQYEGLAEKHKPRRYLAVRLTEDEAHAVFTRNAAEVGILEPVRASMRFREARVFQNLFEGGDLAGFAKTTIPADGDEDSFLDALDAVSIVTIRELQQQIRLLQAQIRTDLERANALLRDPITWIRPRALASVVEIRIRAGRKHRKARALNERRSEVRRAGGGERRAIRLSPA